MNRLAEAGRMIAAHLPDPGERGLEAVMVLEWTPAPFGIHFLRNLVDGRLDGKTDVGALIDQGREVAPHPEILICPGFSGDDLERLLPFLRHLGSWAAPVVRWEFAESLLGPLGVVGSLYNWAWLETGYRLSDWQGQAVVLDMDQSPLVGLSVIHWQGDS
ncbi:MAG: hypothetical protein EA349_04645 [Halomonadaceae bacterium]|nr:MAG: hypothetical protein EA349_04645 [Halomonadaceae bacterium]